MITYSYPHKAKKDSNWICDCKKMWIIPLGYDICGKCKAQHRKKLSKKRVIKVYKPLAYTTGK